MKLIITLICLTALNVFANSSFDSIVTKDGYETNYTLSSKVHGFKISLECQSFFNKFDLYKDNILVTERYITRKECEVLETKTRVCLKERRQVCFKDEDIYEASCSCN